MAANTLHQGRPRLAGGAPSTTATTAMVLVHGRGGDAAGMMQVGLAVADDRMALLALNAANNTWYPERFMEPLANNEPWLTSALQEVNDAIESIVAAGVTRERIVLLGFSQGACLSLEYAARNAGSFGAVVGLAGGLIGPDGTPRDYTGNFNGSPVFMGCGDRDAHIPVARVQETAAVLSRLGANVDARIYKGLEHTIIDDEINAVRALVAKLPKPANE